MSYDLNHGPELQWGMEASLNLARDLAQPDSAGSVYAARRLAYALLAMHEAVERRPHRAREGTDHATTRIEEIRGELVEQIDTGAFDSMEAVDVVWLARIAGVLDAYGDIVLLSGGREDPSDEAYSLAEACLTAAEERNVLALVKELQGGPDRKYLETRTVEEEADHEVVLFEKEQG
ncbi:MAG: hypothetical protein ACOC9T_00090 [Myxococcota bacterium]